jgi:hypothetical protein
MGLKRLKHVSLLSLQTKESLNYYYLDSQSKSTIVNIASPEETRQTDDWFSDGVEGRRYG